MRVAGPALALVLVGVVALVIWLVALVDCLTRRFEDPVTKLMWVLVILLANLIGAVIYMHIGRVQSRPYG
jgi:hypothetical protein